MAFDPSVQVAFFGVMGTALSAGSVAVVALMNNRRERSSAADEGVELALRERLVLKEEMVAASQAEVARKERVLTRVMADREALRQENHELRQETHELREEIERLRNGKQ